MVTPAASLTFTRTIAAPPSEVFCLFTSSPAVLAWLCHAAQVDPRPGGRIYLWWHQRHYTTGILTEVRPDQHLAFTWRGPGDPAATVVRVDCLPARGRSSSGGPGVTSTDLTITHSGVGSGPAWGRTAADIRRGWEAALENLQAVVETGVDLRLAREPVLGLSEADSLGARRAAELGVPVAEGLWIGGVIEGLTAHTAGRRRDDVLVQLDGRPITAWPSLDPVLSAPRAGDRVEAIVYEVQRSSTCR